MGEYSLKHSTILSCIVSGTLAVFVGISAVGCHSPGIRQTARANGASSVLSSVGSSAAVSNTRNSSGSPVGSAISSDTVSATSSFASSSADLSVNQTNPKQKVAYLTFDDGPSKYTPQVLKILKDNDVKATFFISFMGKDTPQKRAWVKQEFEEGNTIGIHSFTHYYPYMYANEENFLADFNRMKGILVSIIGMEPKICRLPGGLGNTVSIRYSGGIIMPKLVSDVEAMGITPFDWNAGGEDAETPYPSASKLASEIINECKGDHTALILMHDTHQFSADAVPEIIRQLKAQGFVFETVTPQSKTFQEHFAGGSHPSHVSHQQAPKTVQPAYPQKKATTIPSKSAAAKQSITSNSPKK